MVDFSGVGWWVILFIYYTIIIIIIITLFQTKWKTLAKQTFGIQIYSNTVCESNFSIQLNTSLKNRKQKTATKHTLTHKKLVGMFNFQRTMKVFRERILMLIYSLSLRLKKHSHYFETVNII